MVTQAAPILKILEPGARAPQGLPWLRLGFRPFYLCAALLATLAIPAWVAAFLGWLPWRADLPALLWHAHEMLFGFAGAVIAGFLLTAGKAWTGLATPRGAALAALTGLWLGARTTALTGPYPVYAALDLALLPIVAAILTRLLLRAGNTRNLPLAALLVLLALANLAFHGVLLGWFDLSPVQPLHAALALIVLIECVMAGRVIPGFTMSATPGLKLTAWPWLEKSALALTALGLTLWVSQSDGWGALTVLALALAGAAHALRQWRWSPAVTRHRPILWILQLAYAWIPAGLVLLALAQIGWVAPSAGIHALAVGATGGLIIGMITRTARGHTGRTLQVGRAEIAAYVLVLLAAALRVFAPLLAGELLRPSLVAAAVAWGVAFAIYLWLYTPWLLRARLDGRDG